MSDPAYPPHSVDTNETPPDAAAKSRLEEFEREDNARRPAFVLTYTEVKLLGIAGVSSMDLLCFPSLADEQFILSRRSVSSWMVVPISIRLSNS